MLLTSSCRASDSLAQADERIDHNRSARHANQRESSVVVEEQPGKGDKRQGFTEEISAGLGDNLLYTADITRDAGQEAPGGLCAKEDCPLFDDVLEKLGAKLVNHPLSSVCHQID